MKKTTRQLQKEQTKELLVQTAYELFSEQGIMKTRMADIANRAGVSHGSVFVHFKTQDILVEEVVETYCRRIAARTHALADACGSLEEFLQAHLSGITEFESFYTRLILENRHLPSGARDSWISIQSAVALHFSQVYSSGENQSKLPETVEVDTPKGVPMFMLFNIWMGMVHYYLENGDLFAPEGNLISRYRELLISSYLKLIQ